MGSVTNSPLMPEAGKRNILITRYGYDFLFFDFFIFFKKNKNMLSCSNYFSQCLTIVSTAWFPNAAT